MKKRFGRKRNREAVDVDITSLLDILTILLVFLLKSYNASDLKLDLTKNLEMADSASDAGARRHRDRGLVRGHVTAASSPNRRR